MRRFVGISIASMNATVLMASCVPAASSQVEVLQNPAAACMNVDSIRADIAALDGQPVIACGILNYEFEDINLYQDVSAARKYSRTQCLSLSMPVDATQDFSAISGRRVRVEAIASANFCPEGAICAASCSESGLHVTSVTPIG